MEKYQNIKGNSGIEAYELGEHSIKIQFKNGAVYLYNNIRLSDGYIEKMKRLALEGEGLNSFVNSKARDKYAHICSENIRQLG